MDAQSAQLSFQAFFDFLFFYEEMLQIPQGGTRSAVSIPMVEIWEECKDHSWQNKGVGGM